MAGGQAIGGRNRLNRRLAHHSRTGLGAAIEQATQPTGDTWPDRRCSDALSRLSVTVGGLLVAASLRLLGCESGSLACGVRAPAVCVAADRATSRVTHPRRSSLPRCSSPANTAAVGNLRATHRQVVPHPLSRIARLLTRRRAIPRWPAAACHRQWSALPRRESRHSRLARAAPRSRPPRGRDSLRALRVCLRSAHLERSSACRNGERLCPTRQVAGHSLLLRAQGAMPQ